MYILKLFWTTVMVFAVICVIIYLSMPIIGEWIFSNASIKVSFNDDNHISYEDKQIIIDLLKLKYIPDELDILSIGYDEWLGDTNHSIEFSINKIEYEKFYEENVKNNSVNGLSIVYTEKDDIIIYNYNYSIIGGNEDYLTVKKIVRKYK